MSLRYSHRLVPVSLQHFCQVCKAKARMSGSGRSLWGPLADLTKGLMQDLCSESGRQGEQAGRHSLQLPSLLAAGCVPWNWPQMTCVFPSWKKFHCQEQLSFVFGFLSLQSRDFFSAWDWLLLLQKLSEQDLAFPFIACQQGSLELTTLRVQNHDIDKDKKTTGVGVEELWNVFPGPHS